MTSMQIFSIISAFVLRRIHYLYAKYIVFPYDMKKNQYLKIIINDKDININLNVGRKLIVNCFFDIIYTSFFFLLQYFICNLI